MLVGRCKALGRWAATPVAIGFGALLGQIGYFADDLIHWIASLTHYTEGARSPCTPKPLQSEYGVRGKGTGEQQVLRFAKDDNLKTGNGNGRSRGNGNDWARLRLGLRSVLCFASADMLLLACCLGFVTGQRGLVRVFRGR